MASALIEHCSELFAPLGAVRLRRMFGGHGVYCDELFFALIVAERLYLKVDAQSQPAFAAAGCEPFTYERMDRLVALGYWSAPPEAMESPALMQPWARLALAAALRARTTQPSAPPGKTRTRHHPPQAHSARRQR